jgi:hypothetical protein
MPFARNLAAFGIVPRIAGSMPFARSLTSRKYNLVPQFAGSYAIRA